MLFFILFCSFYLVGILFSYFIIRSDHYERELLHYRWGNNYEVRFKNELDYLIHLFKKKDIILLFLSWFLVICYLVLVYYGDDKILKYSFKTWNKIN